MSGTLYLQPTVRALENINILETKGILSTYIIRNYSLKHAKFIVIYIIRDNNRRQFVILESYLPEIFGKQLDCFRIIMILNEAIWLGYDTSTKLAQFSIRYKLKKNCTNYTFLDSGIANPEQFAKTTRALEGK